VIEVSHEWVTGPKQGKFSGRIAPLASRQECFGMAFSPFLMKHLHRCDSVYIASFVGTGYTTRR
jgi:hypothetical protein